MTSSERHSAKADARRIEIVHGAASLFDQKGFHGTSLDDVAAEIGLSKAGIYHYFSGKDEILSSIHDELLSWTMSREEARHKYDLSPEQHLLEVIADTLEVISRQPGHVRVFVEHHRELDPGAKREVEERRDRYVAMVSSVIRAGIERGDFREMDPDLATLALFGACNWAYHWLPGERFEDTRDVAYGLWDILVRGLMSDEAKAEAGQAQSPAD